MERATEDQLAERIAAAKQQVTVHGLYAHFKHPERQYRVLLVGIDEASEQPMVTYQALYGNQLIWHRLLSEWLKPTDTGIIRFQPVSA
ncbi:MAG: DUF1653 domain-containing protein [bacterium]|nr:DUF1653 domain-containing protein [bacterium]